MAANGGTNNIKRFFEMTLQKVVDDLMKLRELNDGVVPRGEIAKGTLALEELGIEISKDAITKRVQRKWTALPHTNLNMEFERENKSTPPSSGKPTGTMSVNIEKIELM